MKSGKMDRGNQRPGFIGKQEFQEMGIRGSDQIGRTEVPQVRRPGLRLGLGGPWGSTPARSCSQRWVNPAAGRTRRSGDGVGAVPAGAWDRLEPGGVLHGWQSSQVSSRRLGQGPRVSPALRVEGSRLPVSVSQAPSLTWFPHLVQPLQARLRLSPAIPPGPASPAPPRAELCLCPRFIATSRPL